MSHSDRAVSKSLEFRNRQDFVAEDDGNEVQNPKKDFPRRYIPTRLQNPRGEKIPGFCKSVSGRSMETRNSREPAKFRAVFLPAKFFSPADFLHDARPCLIDLSEELFFFLVVFLPRPPQGYSSARRPVGILDIPGDGVVFQMADQILVDVG